MVQKSFLVAVLEAAEPVFRAFRVVEERDDCWMIEQESAVTIEI